MIEIFRCERTSQHQKIERITTKTLQKCMTDLRQSKNLRMPYMTTRFPHSRSTDHHHSWARHPWPAVIQRPLFFSVYWICTASFSAWSEGSRWKRPPWAPHCVDSVALPQARQHPLRRVTVLEILDPLPWSLTPVRGHRFPGPKLSLFPSLTCKPV